MLIGANSVVSIQYELTNNSGEVLDASAEGEPLTYLHGAGNIIPGLEDALLGKTAGAEFSVTIAPEEAYGPRQEHLVQQVPRDAFPDSGELQIGMQFSAESDQGMLSVVITAVSPDSVTVDANHPLAGETLHFAVRIEEVRQATDDEIAHGHAHGPHGHHHH